MPIRLHAGELQRWGWGSPPPTPQPSCCCHAAMRATNWGEGGGKGGVTPIGFRPANALLAGRWVRVAEAGSSCPCGADGANVTAATWHHTPPPAPPQPANNTPRGGGAAGVQSLQGGAKRMSPPHHQRDIKERRGGGGVGDTTATIYLSVLPGRVSPSAQLSVPPPLLFAPPPGSRSGYRLCLQLLLIAPPAPPARCLPRSGTSWSLRQLCPHHPQKDGRHPPPECCHPPLGAHEAPPTPGAGGRPELCQFAY